MHITEIPAYLKGLVENQSFLYMKKRKKRKGEYKNSGWALFFKEVLKQKSVFILFLKFTNNQQHLQTDSL